MLTEKDLITITDRKAMIKKSKSRGLKMNKQIWNLSYEAQLKDLQAELVNLQQWIAKNKKRVAVILEGRYAAGKGGSIKRFFEHLNPRSMRVVALTKPTDVEKGQWYFRRYIKELPNPGEIVFFDRSWHNRAVFEPAMGFYTIDQYNNFMRHINPFEKMITESGITLIKLYFSITKQEQAKRFKEIAESPLKKWKITPVDLKAQELWNGYTKYKKAMFRKTNTKNAPWKVIDANCKTTARIEAIEHILEWTKEDV